MGRLAKDEGNCVGELGKEVPGHGGMLRCEREGRDIDVRGTLCNRAGKALDKSESILDKFVKFLIPSGLCRNVKIRIWAKPASTHI
jgi:hypothetical protein